MDAGKQGLRGADNEASGRRPPRYWLPLVFRAVQPRLPVTDASKLEEGNADQQDPVLGGGGHLKINSNNFTSEMSLIWF